MSRNTCCSLLSLLSVLVQVETKTTDNDEHCPQLSGNDERIKKNRVAIINADDTLIIFNDTL